MTYEEIDEIERLFAPAMDAAVAIFEKWREERVSIGVKPCTDG